MCYMNEWLTRFPCWWWSWRTRVLVSSMYDLEPPPGHTPLLLRFHLSLMSEGDTCRDERPLTFSFFFFLDPPVGDQVLNLYRWLLPLKVVQIKPKASTNKPYMWLPVVGKSWYWRCSVSWVPEERVSSSYTVSRWHKSSEPLDILAVCHGRWQPEINPHFEGYSCWMFGCLLEASVNISDTQLVVESFPSVSIHYNTIVAIVTLAWILFRSAHMWRKLVVER